MTREEKIQEILNAIRFNLPEVKNAVEKGLELFEEDNGSHPFKEKEEWNEEYIAQNVVWLRKNFSRKRLEHLIEVRNYVRGEIKEIKKEPIREVRREKREINYKKDTEKGGFKEKAKKMTANMLKKISDFINLDQEPQKKAAVRKEKEKYDKKF